MSYINETDFVIENKQLVYPEIITDGLQLYYDAKGKRDTDYHRDTMLDMSGNKNHGELHNFAYEKHSGYKDGLVFDYIDDKLVRPALNLQPNDFTFMLNGNIISFSPDGTVKRVQDGEVIESKGFNMVRNGDFADGMSRWSFPNLKLISRENGVGKFETTSSETAFVHQAISGDNFSENDLIYTSFDSYIPHSATSKYIRWFDYENITLTGSSSDSLTRWSGVFRTGEPHPDYGATIRHHAQGSPGTIIELGRYVFVNLTRAFGVGNEPTKEQMDEIINRFGFIPNAQDLINRIEYKGNDLGDMENIIDGLYKTEALSGEEAYTDKADDSVVHVEIDGKSYQHTGSGKNLLPNPEHWILENQSTLDENGVFTIPLDSSIKVTYRWSGITTSQRYGFEVVEGSGRLINTAYFDIQGNPVVNNDGIHSSNGNANQVMKPGDLNTFTMPTLNSSIHTVRITIMNSPLYNSSLLKIKNIWASDEGNIGYEPPIPTPEYAIDIHSLNDFDVVSSIGKENLFTNTHGPTIARPTAYSPELVFEEGKWAVAFGKSNNIIVLNQIGSRYTLEDGKEYTFSFYAKATKDTVLKSVYLNGRNSGFIPNTDITTKWKRYYFTFIAKGNQATGIHMYPEITTDEINYETFYVADWKLEHGGLSEFSQSHQDITENSNNPFIDKINLLLDEPLRSVGGVNDRLFRDNDGLWKVERNIALVSVADISAWVNVSAAYQTTVTSQIGGTPAAPAKRGSQPISTHFKTGAHAGAGDAVGISVVGNMPQFRIKFNNNEIGIKPDSTLEERIEIMRNWINNNSNTIIQYVRDEKLVEILPQSLQDKLNNLRSFENSNYVYTVLLNENNTLSENLKPTLRAKFLYNNWYKEDRVINNLMIYSRALTNEEMLQNYKTIKRRWGM